MSAAASLRLPQQRANAAAAGATGAFGARGGPSLWAFLAQARRKLRRRLRRVPLRVRGSRAGRLGADCHDDDDEEEEDREEEEEEEEEELMLIMGNDAGDMDSVVSAIALAYLLTYLPDRASALLGDHLPPPPPPPPLPSPPMNAGLAPQAPSSTSSSPLSANFPSSAHAHSPSSSSGSGSGVGAGAGASQVKRRAYIPLIQGFRSEARLRPENLLVLQTFLTQDPLPLPPSPSPISSGAAAAGQTGAASTASQQRQPQPSSMKSAEQIAARAQQQEQAGTSGVSNTTSPRKVTFPTSPSTSSSSTPGSGASSAPEAPPLKRNNTFTLTGSGSSSASTPSFEASSSSAGRGAGAGTSARPAGQSVFRDDAAAPPCLIWLDDVLRPLLAHEARANVKASAAQQQGSTLPTGMRRGSTITGANQNPSANAAVGSVASPTQEIDLDDSYADDHGRRGTITELMTPMPIDTGSDYVSLLHGHPHRRRHRRRRHRADFEDEDDDEDDDDAEIQQPEMDAAELRKRLDLLSRAEQLSPSNGISFGLVDHNRLAPVWSAAAAAPSSRPSSPAGPSGHKCQSTWRNDRVVRLIVDHHADEGAHPLLHRSSAPSTPSESASTAEEAFATAQSSPPRQQQQQEQKQGETLLRIVQSPDVEPVGSCASLVALLFRDELRQEGVVVEQAQMSHPTGAAAFSAGAAAEYADAEISSSASSGAGVADGAANYIGATAVNSPSPNDMAAYARYLAAKHRRKIPRGVVDLLLCPIMIDTDNVSECVV